MRPERAPEREGVFCPLFLPTQNSEGTRKCHRKFWQARTTKKQAAMKLTIQIPKHTYCQMPAGSTTVVNTAATYESMPAKVAKKISIRTRLSRAVSGD